MRKVVSWIDDPVITRLVMSDPPDSIERWVSQINIGRSHVDFGAQNPRAILKLAPLHRHKQCPILADFSTTIRAVFARLSQRTAIFAGLLCTQITDIRLALIDEMQRPVVKLSKVIRCEPDVTAPLISQPLYIGLNRIDEDLAFLLRIGVIKPKVARTTVLLGQTKVYRDGLRMTDV